MTPKRRPTAPTTRSRPLLLRLGLALGALTLLAACGGDDGGEVARGDEDTTTTTAAPGDELEALFEAEFPDDQEGWTEDDGGNGDLAEFTDDGYEVTAVGTSTVLWTYGETGPLDIGDSATTVRVDESGGAADRGYGVLCRLNRGGLPAFYVLAVNGGTGTWTITRWEDNVDPVVLAEGDDEALEGIGEDEEVEITGTCLGEGDGEPVDLSLAVDGEEVGAATDEDGLAPGISGLLVVPYEATEADVPVVFTGIEIRGVAGDGQVTFESDLADESTGFSELDSEFAVLTFEDGGLAADVTGQSLTPIPVRVPLPPTGSVELTVEGDLSQGFTGICLEGPDGAFYEFAIADDGYASLGYYTAGENDFELVDEVTGAFEDRDEIRMRARWRTDGSETDLAIDVDGETMVTASGDERITSFQRALLCTTVATAAGDDARVRVLQRDLVFTGED